MWRTMRAMTGAVARARHCAENANGHAVAPNHLPMPRDPIVRSRVEGGTSLDVTTRLSARELKEPPWIVILFTSPFASHPRHPA
jgi:hypothetical protein